MAGSPDSTAFILVPGGFSLASLFHKVTDRLTKLGYTAIESDNPTTVHPDKAHKGFYDDAEHVRSTASNLMDKGKNVILVGNSYGGFVITEAAKGLSKADREAAGKSGGSLINLVYFGSLLARLGLTCQELVSGVVEVEMGGAVVMDPPPAELGAAMTMSDLDKEEQQKYGSQFQTQAQAAFHQKLTYCGYLHVPTTYVVTEKDNAVPPKVMHESVDIVIASGKAEIKKRTIDSDHCAMISHPDELVEILVEAAGQNRE